MSMAKRQAHGLARGDFPHLRGIVLSWGQEGFAIRAKSDRGIIAPAMRNRRPDGAAGGRLPQADDFGLRVCRQGDLAVGTEGQGREFPWALEGLPDGFACGCLPKPSRTAIISR